MLVATRQTSCPSEACIRRRNRKRNVLDNNHGSNMVLQGTPTAEDALKRLDVEASTGMPDCNIEWNIQACSPSAALSSNAMLPATHKAANCCAGVLTEGHVSCC